MKVWLLALLALLPQEAPDAARRHVEEITVSRAEYRVSHGGTMRAPSRRKHEDPCRSTPPTHRSAARVR